MQQRRFYPVERGYQQPRSVSMARHHRDEDAEAFAAYDQVQYSRFDPAGVGTATSRPWLAARRDDSQRVVNAFYINHGNDQ